MRRREHGEVCGRSGRRARDCAEGRRTLIDPADLSCVTTFVVFATSSGHNFLKLATALRVQAMLEKSYLHRVGANRAGDTPLEVRQSSHLVRDENSRQVMKA